MKTCEHYISGELTNEMYCNADNCIYKIIVEGRILPDCSVDGKFDGPCLDKEISLLSEEAVEYILKRL